MEVQRAHRVNSGFSPMGMSQREKELLLLFVKAFFPRVLLSFRTSEKRGHFTLEQQNIEMPEIFLARSPA